MANVESLVYEHFHVKITFGRIKLCDMTNNSITELPEVGVQQPEWRVTTQFSLVSAWQCVGNVGNCCTRYIRIHLQTVRVVLVEER